MTLQLAVELNQLTWRDLTNFVDTARGNVELDSAVDVELDDESTENVPMRLTVNLDAVASTVVMISRDKAKSYSDLIDTIIDNEGDARFGIDELKELRKALS